MTQGIELIAKVIELGSVSLFRSIQPEWLVGDEVGLRLYISDYLTRYNQLPGMQALEQNGYRIAVPGLEPVRYYFDAVTTRYLMNVARDECGTLVSAVRDYDASAVRDAATRLTRASVLGLNHLDITTLQVESVRVLDRAADVLYRDLLGYPTGYEVLDRTTGGWQPGDVNVIVGRPNTGKSNVLIRSASESWKLGYTPLFISLEMSTIQMATRMFGLYSGLNPRQFQTGEISTFVQPGLRELAANLATDQVPFYFLSGEVKKSITEVEAAIEQINPHVIYIDAGYLLTTDSSRRHYSRHEGISDVIESLKGLAVKHDKSIVTTVQFNRTVPTRRRGEVELSLESIGGTDVIGQIASNVLGIHPPQKDPISRRYRILESLKNRDGDLIKFKINHRFDPPNFDFVSLVSDDETEEQVQLRERTNENLRRMEWMV